MVNHAGETLLWWPHSTGTHTMRKLDRRELMLHFSCHDRSDGQWGDGGRDGPGFPSAFPVVSGAAPEGIMLLEWLGH